LGLNELIGFPFCPLKEISEPFAYLRKYIPLRKCVFPATAARPWSGLVAAPRANLQQLVLADIDKKSNASLTNEQLHISAALDS